ncbi:MAG: hypothetical protein LBS56_07550 [Propionibacteriaceae bacterium]|jgi:hypothetical protein|nr:hypothetical protein [Propionibacteriaceae bacterium]
MGDWEDGIARFRDELSEICVRLVYPEVDAKPVIEIDELAFMGVLGGPPAGLEHLSGGVFQAEPEVYLFGLRDGDLIGGAEWFAGLGQDNLDQAAVKLKDLMAQLVPLHERVGQTPPNVVMNAISFKTGEAVMIREDRALPKVPSGMTPADLIFDRWVTAAVQRGSAYEHLRDL